MTERFIGFIIGVVAMFPLMAMIFGSRSYWKGKYNFLETMHELLEDQYETLYHRMKKDLPPPSEEELIKDTKKFLDKRWGV